MFTDHLWFDGQFASTTLDETGEHDGGRPAVIEDFIERGANGPPGVQHVIHQNQVTFLDVDRKLRSPDLGVHADTGEVVAVERNVERAQRFLEVEQLMQPLGDPYAAGMDTDHERTALEHRLQLLDHARYGGFDIDRYRYRHGLSPGSSFR